MKNKVIGVIGMGYVGLPLSIELGKKYSTLGFDINEERIFQLNKFIDSTNEIKKSQFEKSKDISKK